MNKLTLILLAAITWLLAAETPAAHAQTGPLFEYVARPDDNYAWTFVDSTQLENATIAEIVLTSQSWHRKLWKHLFFVIKPPRIATGGQALLVIGGGRWRNGFENRMRGSTLPDEAEMFAELAARLETIVVVVAQVPFQPLFRRREDELIAYTFDKFLRRGDPEWPLLLPMVKATVRAMDAGREVAKQLWNADIDTYTLLGGSKRGWTAWLTAAVDDRVTAIAPLVFDALNMQEHFPHQTAVWGAPSEEIRPYTDRNLHNVLSTDEGRALRDIVDPYAYLARLQLPKLIVNATNDEFFPLDSINLYWRALEGPRHALYLPNSGHSSEEFGRIFASLNTFHREAAGLTSMPALQWRYTLERDTIRLCVTSEPAPSGVTIWTATSADRDFRDEHWTPSPISVSATAEYEYALSEPTSGYVGLYAELTFGAGDGSYTLTTTPAVSGRAGAGVSVWSAVDEGDACGETN